MTDKPLQAADDLVVRAARGMNRRRFLRGAGSAALAGAATTAFLSRPSDAGVYPGGHICGPSPYCNHSTRCDGYRCHQTTQTSYRGYGGSTCTGSSGTNCWSACKNGTRYYCCDCCVDNYPGDDVYGRNAARCYGCCCNPSWWQCICHSAVGSC